VGKLWGSELQFPGQSALFPNVLARMSWGFPQQVERTRVTSTPLLGCVPRALSAVLAVVAASMCVFAAESAAGHRLSVFQARVAAGDELEVWASLRLSNRDTIVRAGIRGCTRTTPHGVECDIALEFRRSWPDGYLVRCTRVVKADLHGQPSRHVDHSAGEAACVADRLPPPPCPEPLLPPNSPCPVLARVGR
jgi:hypothetical protein